MEKRLKRMKIDLDSSLDTNRKNTDPISMYLVEEILQRLPANSIAKFVRLSKSLASIIRSNYFINSFSLRQSMKIQTQQQPHRLLFAFNEVKDFSISYNNWTFFSSSSVNLEKASVEYISRLVSQDDGRYCAPTYVKGLLSFIYGETQVISNPSTGKSIVLPVVKSRRKILRRYFGFDPINGEYKVLCIIDAMYARGSRITPSQNQVLTVGSKSLWRELEFWIPHRPVSECICIDGIIYYLAFEALALLELIIVRFDVKSEKFLKELPCVFLDHPLRLSLSLISYKSKLAIVHKPKFHSFDLWVLEDVEKLEWLKITHNACVGRCSFCRSNIEILGFNPSGETIYTCYGHDHSFSVICYDHKKNQHRRVQIRESLACRSTSFVSIYAFSDYVESLMLL